MHINKLTKYIFSISYMNLPIAMILSCNGFWIILLNPKIVRILNSL